MIVSDFMIREYGQMDTWSSGKNKPNSNPIQSQNKAKTKPIQSQYKPNTKPIQTQCLSATPFGGLARHQCGGTKAKKSCCRGNPHAGHRAATVVRIKIVTVLLTLPCIDGTLSPLQFKESDLWNYHGQ